MINIHLILPLPIATLPNGTKLSPHQKINFQTPRPPNKNDNCELDGPVWSHQTVFIHLIFARLFRISILICLPHPSFNASQRPTNHIIIHSYFYLQIPHYNIYVHSLTCSYWSYYMLLILLSYASYLDLWFFLL